MPIRTRQQRATTRIGETRRYYWQGVFAMEMETSKEKTRIQRASPQAE